MADKTTHDEISGGATVGTDIVRISRETVPGASGVWANFKLTLASVLAYVQGAITFPVTSVNGGTGAVTLIASDVGASSASHTHTAAGITDFTEAAQDAALGAIVDSDTIDFGYSDGSNTATGDVRRQMSITADSSGLKLVADNATPGNNKVYGTDGTGAKGWKNDPAGGGPSGQRFVDIEGPQNAENYFTDNSSGVYEGGAFSMAGDSVLEQFQANNLWFTSFDFSGCTSLLRFELGNNNGSSFDFTGCISMSRCLVQAGGPVIVDGCISLERLMILSSALTSLDVTDCTALVFLSANNNPISSLDLSVNIALVWVEIGNGGTMTSLTLPGTAALEHLYVFTQALTTLDLTGCTGLIELDIGENLFTSIDISPATALQSLYFGYCTGLTTITMTGITSLVEVSFDNTAITSFPFAAQTHLGTADCSNANLSTIDLSGLAELEDFFCYNQAGGLTALTLSGNTLLSRLEAQGNGLTTFPSMTDAPAMNYLDASGNALPEATVDQILADLDAGGIENGFCGITGGTNAPPSAAGNVSIANLMGKGWGIATN